MNPKALDHLCPLYIIPVGWEVHLLPRNQQTIHNNEGTMNTLNTQPGRKSRSVQFERRGGKSGRNTPLKKAGGVKGISVLFSLLQGELTAKSRHCPAGDTVCVKPQILLGLGFWGMFGTQLKSQLRTAESKFAVRSPQGWIEQHFMGSVALLWEGCFVCCPLCGWISSCSVSSCLNLPCQDLIMA